MYWFTSLYLDITILNHELRDVSEEHICTYFSKIYFSLGEGLVSFYASRIAVS